MELKEFIEKAVSDIVDGIIDCNQKSNRQINLVETRTNRTIEFDIAVSAEEKGEKELGGGIKVLRVVQAKGSINTEHKNSTVTRIKFGVRVSQSTKEELAREEFQSEDFFNEDDMAGFKY